LKERGMIVEIINTGSELMLGRVLNTHQQWLCRELADLGHVVSRQVSVADTGADIEEAVRESLSRADLVITTGGLGPTSDDITRERVAHLIGRRLIEDPAVVTHIAKLFEKRNWFVPERTRLEAQVPEGARVFLNAYGTAPGLAMELRPNIFRGNHQPSWLVMLPGPPRELRPMFTDSVKPLLKEVFKSDPQFVCRTLRSMGIGESTVEEKLSGHLQPLQEAGLEIGYCARPGQVDVRLVARNAQATELVSEGEKAVRATLGLHVYGTEGEELEEVVIRILTARKQTLAVAESCTGGCLANLLTNVPGASAVLLAGLVTYSNEAKQTFLGVRPETLAQHGAVSAPTAGEMAAGARQRTGATYALSLTGIAGPGGGSPEKPVGTFFIGLAGPEHSDVVRRFNPTDRLTFKQLAAQQALDLLRRTLEKAV
jgi:nicotinamide-nucleotide amidase